MPVPRVPGFVLQSKIGSGTFSDVYKACRVVNTSLPICHLNPEIIIFFCFFYFLIFLKIIFYSEYP